MAQSMRIRDRVDRWAKAHTNIPERNPKVVWLLAVFFLSVAPAAVGLQELPGSLERVPAILGQGSALAVAAGCLLSLIGLLWPKRDTGLGCEIGGSMILAVGCLFYAYALFIYQTPANRSYAFGTTAGLGLGCLFRAVQIGLYVRGRKLRGDRP